MRGPIALAVVLLLPAAARAGVVDYHRCNRIQWGGLDMYIDGDRTMARSTQGGGGSDTAFWDSPSVFAVNRAWRAWDDLDLTNPRISISGTSDHGFNSLPDSVNVVHKHTAVPTLARIVYWPAVFAPIITEFDIELRGRTTLNNPPTGMPAIGPRERCAHNLATMAGGLVHELGHAYGYEHWLDWISTMNPGHRDALSCERPEPAPSIMKLTPDALSTRCHDIAYGLDDADLDVSGSPVRQTCALASGTGCSSAMSALTRLPPDATFAFVVVAFTTFNNLGAVDRDIGYRLVLSRDAYVSADDREVGRGVLGNWSQGATVTRVLGGRMNPSLDLPLIGVPYRVLVRLDSTNLLVETNELNNTIDTDVRYVRE